MSPARAAGRVGRGGRVIGAIRENAFAAGIAVIALLVTGWLGLYGWAWTDWDTEARPAVDALLAGHVAQFLTLAPVYGGSLILRAPFVLLTKLWHGGELAVYRASAAPCLAATGALGVWLVARLRVAGASQLARAVVLMLCVANPLTLSALEIGHPEELLGAVLCIAAVLCAMDDRPIWAAVLVGLAIPNKEWAVLAIGPVLVALRHGRLRALVVTGGVAALLLAPYMLVPHFLSTASGDGTAVSATANAVGSGAIFQPWQIWWFLGSHGHIVRGLFGQVKVGYRTPPGWIEPIAHPLIVAMMVPLTGLYAGIRGRRSHRVPNSPLLLLALLLALRCVLDPWDISYYALPCVLTVVSWEAISFSRAPVLGLLGTLAAWFIFVRTATLGLSADLQALVFVTVSVPSVVALTLSLYAPGLARRLLPRRERDASAVAAGWPIPATQNVGAGT